MNGSLRLLVRALVLALVTASSVAAGGCAGSSGDVTEKVGLRADTALPARAGTVVIDGCVVDTWQRAVLARPGARKLVKEIVLLCLVPRLDGTVGPRDASAAAHLSAVASDLGRDGYRVHFGVAFTDETGQRYDGAQTRGFLADPAWRARFVATLPEAAGPAQGVEIDLQQLPDDARASVTALVTETSRALRPGKKLGVFVPPSVSVPSDLPGGEAFARSELAKVVDRMRVMTLDYSESGPGPTTEPGWAVDAARVALRDAPGIVDVAYPLYGTDFGPRGRRSVTYFDAIGISAVTRSPVERGPTGAPFVRFLAFGGEPHELWFDDADSTGRALGAWSHDVLPPEVGVVFYGLGAEDPELFERLGARTP